MKLSIYKSYDDLPLFLNARTVANVLGVSISSAYELMHEPDFPTLKVGSRLAVPRTPSGSGRSARREVRNEKIGLDQTGPHQELLPPPQ